jgi:chemotaxis protein MotB
MGRWVAVQNAHAKAAMRSGIAPHEEAKMRRSYLAVVTLVVGVSLTGCTNQKLMAQKDHEIEARDQTIADLQGEIARLEHEAGSARERADQLNQDLQNALSSLEEKEKLSLSSDKDRSMITLPNAATFDSGSAKLTAEGRMIIDKVWEVLSRYPDRKIMVEGHTDNVPIATEYQDRFKSNWELSAARALAVVHYVREKFETDPERLAAVGCGEYQPVADNETPEGRSKNRRVVVVVAPQSTDVAEGH